MFETFRRRARPRALAGTFVAAIAAGLALTGAAIADRPSSPPTAVDTATLAATPAPPVPAPAVRGDVDCLTRVVYFEARGESQAGQAAVAQVVINRTRQGGFPKTVCGVVYQRARAACQFSFVCDRGRQPVREPAAWRQSRLIARRALGGYVMSAVGPATSFHVARSNHPASAGLVRVARLGGHDFYRRRATRTLLRG